ncbi:Uu.00g002520.m01.CDS01 [Anthostomella pinea]|uniref:Uu.00g002520.m01.CDS01 n=1 Tax=Anthostomella pinea TaxID=933095 RepID=A0AAI8YIM5_9PEZI|nr:Uu.00g002520.m01.CDS01 [Anthostomella pinea]
MACTIGTSIYARISYFQQAAPYLTKAIETTEVDGNSSGSNLPHVSALSITASS